MMRPQNPYKSAIEPPINNPLSVMQPGEQLIFEVKRHPIGMLSMYIMAGFLVLAIAAISFGVLPSALTSIDRSQALTIGLIIVMLTMVLVAIFLFISNKVYWGNSWILTSDSLIQVTQSSLFDKQSSQLSLHHLEDVAAQQNGIMAHLFNFGVITAESAGATDKFIFNFCPRPNDYARMIVAAREQLEQKSPEVPEQRPPAGPSQSPNLPEYTIPS